MSITQIVGATDDAPTKAPPMKSMWDPRASQTGRTRVKIATLPGGVAIVPPFDGEDRLNAKEEGEHVFQNFVKATQEGDWKSLGSLFVDNAENAAFWRENVGLTFDRRTFTGKQKIVEAWKNACDMRHPHSFELRTSHTEFNIGDEATFLRLSPVLASLEVPFSFVTSSPAAMQIVGSLKCIPQMENGKRTWKIWILITTGVNLLEKPFGSLPRKIDERSSGIPLRQRGNFAAQGLPQIQESTVLDAIVIGASISGLGNLIQLDALGLDIAGFDMNVQAGTEWAQERYQGLRLHHNKHLVQLPRFPVPEDYDMYMSGSDLARYFAAAIKELQLPMFAGVRVESCEWQTDKGHWRVCLMDVKTADKSYIRTRNIVLCTGFVTNQKYLNMPDLPGRDKFSGQVIHTADVRSPKPFHGQDVVIVGTGNSAHDVANMLVTQGSPKSVTLLQRSPTALYDFETLEKIIMARYQGDIPVNTADFAETSLPTGVMRDMAGMMFKFINGTPEQKARHAEFEKLGYMVDTNPCLISRAYEERGRAFYLDQPKTFPLVFDGKIKINRGQAVGFSSEGLIVRNLPSTKDETNGTEHDERTIPAQAVIMATGYRNVDLPHEFEKTGFMDAKSAAQLENVGLWGCDKEGELPGYITASGHPNFYFAGIGFMTCRWISRFVAIQVAADIMKQMPQRLERHLN